MLLQQICGDVENIHRLCWEGGIDLIVEPTGHGPIGNDIDSLFIKKQENMRKLILLLLGEYSPGCDPQTIDYDCEDFQKDFGDLFEDGAIGVM